MIKMNKLAVCLFPLILASSAAYANNTEFTKVLAQKLPLDRGVKIVGAMNSAELITFSVWAKTRHQSELMHRALKAMHSHEAPIPADDSARYAPSLKSKKAIEVYFKSYGMSAQAQGAIIQVKGTVEQAQNALHVSMNRYTLDGQEFYTNAEDPLLPKELAKDVSVISGLGNLTAFKMNRSMEIQKQLVENNLKAFATKDAMISPTTAPSLLSLNGFTGDKLRKAYKADTLGSYKGVPVDGAGQTIVILAPCGTLTVDQILSDVNQFSNASTPNLQILYGSAGANTPKLKVMLPEGTEQTGQTSCPYQQAVDGNNRAIAVGIAGAHAMAPKANILLVWGDPNDPYGSNLALNNLLSTASNSVVLGLNNVNILAGLWGLPEDGTNVGQAQATALDISMSQAIPKIAFFYPTGDCGDGLKCSNASPPRKEVQNPASSIFATAVGGTSLFVDSSWNYSFEVGWGFVNAATNQFTAGSGGGISRERGYPQQGLDIGQKAIAGMFAGGYGEINAQYCQNVIIPQYTIVQCRALPDVSMLADPLTPLNIFVGGVATPVAGTALATSLVAGVQALSYQLRAIDNKTNTPPVPLNSLLYPGLNQLRENNALNLISAPHAVVPGTLPNPPGAPNSAFTLLVQGVKTTFNWDSTLTIIPNQPWDDVAGLGSLNVPFYLLLMGQVP